MSVMIWAVDGVHWHDKPVPRRWHRCRAATRGIDGGMRVERCACGAIRLGGRFWLERNSRRRAAERKGK